MFDLDYNNITEGVIIAVLGTVLGTAIIAFFIWLYKFKKKHERSESVAVPIYFYNEIVENALKVQKFEMQAVHDEEKTFLLAEITKLNNRPADSDEINARIATLEFTSLLAEITKLNNRPAELDEITARIDALEFTLMRKVNEIITKKLVNSKIASEKEKNND